MLILEIFLFFFLHTSIVDSRIEEELAALQARGNSHRDVLENSYNEETLHHIAVMEAKADTEVNYHGIKSKHYYFILEILDNEEAK